MKISGGCYCRALRYEGEAEPVFRAQCHCRECQYISGGGPNFVLGVPETAFRYLAGEPEAFSRKDLENPVSREFCANCGTHILTRAPGEPGVVILKVGTLDDPAAYGGPQIAIWTSEAPPFHQIAEGVHTFPRTPG